ncbi:hypothetical protein JX265_011222 [Neoarthrinium moseri]|uniref:Uncharacterized protein n=1 Tax=Neoarthrinium moseri TaxID=1658444 RepID=A0A9Q0AJW2_9PEZI|nr:uncharacterized protein JN550_010528 [Neoarthrinium moseri]KAI1845883.1 hypothetical protein JX266_007970 [Neoarthrinium moseri]KAI1857487.1 hypothetical protein JX265_011222 [Neoarthrinium moseri]KAI1862063.1 hypothetical protein JN550_010528 [Neoarthrinium moseri]
MSPEASGAPPISGLLTVIITTSVTPSAPSTDLISTILSGFRKHCAELLHCRVIVVFDNYDQITPQARLKKGQVTPEQAQDWDLYKENVKDLILEKFQVIKTDSEFVNLPGEAEYGSPFMEANTVAFDAVRSADKRVTFIEPSRRLGFGLAVRTALRMTDTPYVWIQQHDWGLVADVPAETLLQVMAGSESDDEAPVKYVCFPAVRMLEYATSGDVEHFTVLKDLTSRLRRDFMSASNPKMKIPLTPLFFWHDKPHVASTGHYLATVFPSRLAMLRGDFIEDKIGQRARSQMKEGHWSKWATWLYYPEHGRQLCLRHLQGRTRMGAEDQSKRNAAHRERNKKELQQKAVFQTSVLNQLDDADDIGLEGLF